jgi:hypothetical protein
VSGTRCAAAAIARITLVDGRSIASKSIGDDILVKREKEQNQRKTELKLLWHTLFSP